MLDVFAQVRFYDETDDSYRIYTYRTGVHSVTYDSDKPRELCEAWATEF